MRLTYAAVLFLALAACGGDGGLSLTEPGEVPICETATGAFAYAGVWRVEEWGCYGRAAPGGPIDCDPSGLVWTSTPEIAVTQTGADMFRMTIDATTFDAAFNGVAVGGDNATDMLYLTGCADGSGYVFTMHYPTSDSFAAYAYRRR